MKKEIGLAVIVVLLCSGVSYGMAGRNNKKIEEEIKERETVLISSFSETIARKDKEIAEKNSEIAEKDAEIEKLKIENAQLSTKLEEMTKKTQELEKMEETRTLEEIITTEITKYAQIIPSSEGLKIIFNIDFFFYYDVLEPPIYRSLDVIVKALKIYPEHQTLINGYTDSMGNEETNLKTSLIKAKAVANYFVAKGILEEKIVTGGLGSANPIDTNETKEGRKQNRRVEVIIK